MKLIIKSLTFLLITSCMFCCVSALKQIKAYDSEHSNNLFLADAFGSSDYRGSTNSQEADLRQQASQGFDTAGKIYHSSDIKIPPVSKPVQVYDENYERQRQKQQAEEERRLAEQRKRIEEEQRRLEQEKQRRKEERRRQEELELQRQEEQRLWQEHQRQREEERRLEEQRELERQRQLQEEQQRLLELENKRKECGNGYMHQSSYNCQECCTALNAPHYEYNTQDYEEPVCTCNW